MMDGEVCRVGMVGTGDDGAPDTFESCVVHGVLGSTVLLGRTGTRPSFSGPCVQKATAAGLRDTAGD